MTTSSPERAQLSPAEHRAYVAIKNHIRSHGVAPTIREIAGQVHYSYAHVKRLVDDLDSKGWIVRSPGVHRSIRLVTSAAETAHTCPNCGFDLRGQPSWTKNAPAANGARPSSTPSTDVTAKNSDSPAVCVVRRRRGGAAKKASAAKENTPIPRLSRFVCKNPKCLRPKFMALKPRDYCSLACDEHHQEQLNPTPPKEE